MKKKLLFLIILIVLISSCSQQKETIKIGLLTPLSGVFSRFGEDILNGTEQGMDPAVKLIIEDTKCENNPTINAFKKLTEIDKVSLILGPMCGSPQEIVAPLIKEKDILALVPVAASRELFRQSGEKVYRMQYSLETDAAFMAEQIAKFGHTFVGLVTYQNAFSYTQAKTFKKYFSGKIIEITVPDATTEIASLITKLKETPRLDAIYITDAAFFVQNGTRKLKELGIDVPLFSQYATEYEPIRDMVEGVTYSFPEGIGDQGATVELAKESAELLSKLALECKGNPTCVRQKLKNSGNFNKYGISNRNIVLKKIDNSQPKMVNLPK